MALVSFNEDICERLFDDLENMGRRSLRTQTIKDRSLEELDAHAKAHRKACDKALYEFMEMVTDPQYSNASIAKENDRLKKEISELKEFAIHYLEAITKKDQQNDLLLSKLRARNEQIKNLEALLANCRREMAQLNNPSNIGPVSSNIKKPGKRKCRRK
ncbi:MAG: hypothetical protein NTZ48_07405 [Candidatus Omnitrophica bacterium]|nr:hypothetical protein [Candidatus Omnitrophota bacterium]